MDAPLAALYQGSVERLRARGRSVRLEMDTVRCVVVFCVDPHVYIYIYMYIYICIMRQTQRLRTDHIRTTRHTPQVVPVAVHDLKLVIGPPRGSRMPPGATKWVIEASSW